MPGLLNERDRVVDALVALSSDEDVAARVLKLGATQLGEIATNVVIRSAPTMRAVDRYTGVLFDALAADSLDAPARRWLGGHVMIHSAPFGPIGALDLIPSYRLGAGISLPGIDALRRIWAGPVTQALRAAEPGFVLDLRSEAYVALGPVPEDVPHSYVRVVTEGADGAVRALNHFNKHAKGALVRLLAHERPRIRSRAGLLSWSDRTGAGLRSCADGVVELVVSDG